MAKLIRPSSPSSVILRVKLMDSTSISGAGLTGVTSGSAGLTISTLRSDESSPVVYGASSATIEDIATFGTYVSPTSGKCRFKEISSSLLPGIYELQLDNTRYAAPGTIVAIFGAANLAQADYEVQCENLSVSVSGVNPLVRVMLSASQPDYNVAKETSATANMNSIMGYVSSVSGNVWSNATRTLTGSVSLDPATRVVLSASQPDYTPATSLEATNIYNRIGTPISGSISNDIQNISTAVVAGVPQNYTSISGTLVNGTSITGSYVDTKLINNVYWTTAPSGTQLGGFGLNESLYFNVGSTRVSQISIAGRFQNATGSARSVDVWAYSYTTSGYTSISNTVIRMNHSTTDQIYSYTLLPEHQDTNGNCIIRLTSTSTSTGDRLYVDQMLVKAVAAGATANEIATAVSNKMIYSYYDGHIWIDTENGFPGTDLGVHGLPTHPVNNLNDAVVLATALGTKTFFIRTESSIQLNQNFDGWVFDGWGYYVDLNGWNISDTVFRNSHVSGASVSGATDGDMHFDNCYVENSSLSNAVLRKCILTGTMNLLSQNNIFDECIDGTNSLSTPIIEFHDGAELQMRKYSGGIQFNSMNASTDIVIDGAGRIIVDSSCVGGKLTVRGHFTITDNSSGLVSITKEAMFNVNQPLILTSAYDAAKSAAQEISATANKNLILSSITTISGDVDTLLTANHGAGNWGAGEVTVGPVVLSGTQPYYAPATMQIIATISGDVDTLLTANHGAGNWGAGEVTVGPVVLSGTQPYYAPARITDPLILTSAYDAAKTAMQANTPVVLSASQPNYDIARETSATANKNSIMGYVSTVSGDVWTNVNRTLTGNVSLEPTTRVVLSAAQPDYSVAKETSATANKNSIVGYITTVSGDVWTNVNRTLTSSVTLDPAARVVLSASQPDYSVAKETSATANKNSIVGYITTVSGDVWTNVNRTLTGNVSLDPTTRVVLSASQPDYSVAKETSATANKNSIMGYITTVSGDVWVNVNRTLTSSVTLDPAARVVLSASQPDYSVAKETSATANKNSIMSYVSTVSGNVWTNTERTLTDSVTLDPNTRVVLSATQSDYNIPESVDLYLTQEHGAGNWDAVNENPVVLSGTQPYYAPALVGSEMSLSLASISAIQDGLVKHSDTIDGKTVDYVLEAIMAMANGNFSISGDTLTLYKRDNSTPFSVMTKTSTSRSRTI
jgi:hypothetical protein